jgi:CRISPR/Cas system-associated exonuclease Cas4 (RecB family)
MAEVPARAQLYDKGVNMLKTYVARDKRDGLLGKIVEHEKKHELEYDGYTVVGIIDVVYGADGKIDIEDYKTSARAKTKEEADEDYQLSTYALIYYKKTGIIPNSVSLYYPHLGKLVTTTRTLQQILDVEKYNNDLYNEMSKETAWAANHSACFNCDYIHNCPSRTKIRLH